MSADHRKPVVAFIVLAFIAAALVGIQRADAETGRFLALVIHGKAVVHGTVPLAADNVQESAVDRLASLVPGGDGTRFVPAEPQGSGEARADDADPRHERANRDGRPSRGTGPATDGGRDPLESARNGGRKALSDASRTSRTDSLADRPASRSDRPSGRRGAGDPGRSGGHRSSFRGPHDAERTASSVVGRRKP